jgi:hypothetical protein
MRQPPVVVVAGALAGLLYLMLDSGAFSPEPAPRLTSLSLGALALLFGLGAWGLRVSGQAARSRLPLAVAMGAGAYALVRLVVV